MALHFGADAVYLAGAQFGMRAGAENFTPDGIRAAVQLAHAQGAAVHVTCNTLPRDDEMAQLPAYLELLDDAGVDAIIAADLGVITLAKRYAPHVALHVSTQFGVVNSAAAAALHDLGAQRVVLARELSLAEIAAIRAHTPPELELEAFVHGAMCVSFSGRCLLSNYLTGRDANRGRCAQPCRWKYGLTESKRPGQVFDITEDARGTYIFNSRDMCMIDHLPELLAAGITSLKIEGRTKSAYYVGAVTNAYRHALDDAVGDQTSQRGGERLVSGGRELALQLVVARRAVQVQAEQNWQLALALYQGECVRETSVLDAVAREHDPLFCPCHGSFLYALH